MLSKSTDEWETPIEYWKKLVPFLNKEKTIIYDPFYMNGNAKLKWEELGFKCIHPKTDFFHSGKPIDENLIIISSPPFSKKKRVFEKLLEWNRPFIMLMNTDTFFQLKMQKILKNKVQLIVPDILLGFINKNGVQTQCSPFYLCFIAYKMNLERDIVWV